MTHSYVRAVLVFGCAALSLLAGCGGAGAGAGGGGGDNDAAGASGSSAAIGGGGDAGVLPQNFACPEIAGPFAGPAAQRGACCHRATNSARLSADDSADVATLEYRINNLQTINHPLTLGHDTIRNLNILRIEAEQQSLLWRFEAPQKDGELASGDGMVTVGVGRYNCDGTYSYYSDTAAPRRPESSDDAKRWAPKQMPVKVDVEKQGPARYQPVWRDNYNRGLTAMPYLNTGTFAMDWELWDQGFALEDFPTDDAAIDCIGERTDSNLWEPGGAFVAYVPLDLNDGDPISSLAEQTMCQLLAFGVVVDKNDPNNRCSETARCEPGTGDCTWQKLPDSLCPMTDDDRALWGCHIGYEDNPDGEPTSCTAEAPSAALDPDQGAMSAGQCCDPLGVGAGGLPACNAYMLRNVFVAAAAEITDERKDALQENCTGQR